MSLRSENKNIYWAWKSMKQRCKNPNCKAYKNYGERGIKVCEEWEEFEPFLSWSLSNGYSKGLDLDRKDNDGDYTPDNCRWISREENINNRRNTIKISVNGETLPETVWARKIGVDRALMQTRQDIATIKAMKSEKEEQALNLYMENNNLALAIQMINRYEQEKAEILRRKEKEEQERRDRELERERERVREEERARIREEERLKAEAEQKAIDQIKTVDEVKAAELTTEDSKTVVFTVKATDAELEEIEMALTSLGVYFERKDV